MPRRTVQPPSLMVPAAPYVPAVASGGMLWISGQVAISSEGEIVGEGDITAQTRQVLENLNACLQAAEMELTDVVKTTVYLTDMANYAAFNEVYAQYFSDNPPARSTLQVDPLVRPSFLIEIEAVAMTDISKNGAIK